MGAIEQQIEALYEGWHAYQQALIAAIQPLSAEQLTWKAAPHLRSIGQNAQHIIGARARWFYMLMGEGGEDFEANGKWDRREAVPRSAPELVQALGSTWRGMQAVIGRWTEAEWEQTWPGEDEGEPETITRQWVIWHLIEHDLHHGGEISLTLGIHGEPGLNL